jgi:hypothetical protein
LLNTADTPYSISCWLKKDNTDAGQQILLGKDESATYLQYLLGWVGNFFGFRSAYANHVFDTIYHAAWNADVIDEAPHYAVALWDGTHIRLYADGVEASAFARITQYVYADANRHSIGRYGGYGGYYFDGIIDEVRISSVARSAEWIAYEYANMNPADGGLTWGAEALTGGFLDGTLFRIVKLVKKPETNVTEITCAVWGNSAT